jgi:hypothetical protein
MAAPMVIGRIGGFRPPTTGASQQAPSSNAARSIAASRATSTVANATQRSCWRSIPRARRKRHGQGASELAGLASCVCWVCRWLGGRS